MRLIDWAYSRKKYSDNVQQVENEVAEIKDIKDLSVTNSAKKYPILITLFVVGLILVSTVKNKTRSLQKEINKIQASISGIEYSLHQALLDNQVITSPENISRLAKEHLDSDFIFYKRSQLKGLKNSNTTLSENNNKKLNKTALLKKKIEKKISSQAKKQKKNLKKIKDMYKNPNAIPDTIKGQVVKKIDDKKKQIKSAYNSPKDFASLDRAKRWGLVQVGKVILGFPIVPGR
jgi:hypothetical protein